MDIPTGPGVPEPGALRSRLRAMESWILELRRDLHCHPELRFQEFRTSDRIAAGLEGLDLEIRRGIAGTGLVAILRGGPGPVIGIRADMDALPVAEATGLPFASRVPGLMHACGHDAHAAVVAGLARTLASWTELRARLPGSLVFVFQPAEEGALGAREMVEQGVLDDPPISAMLGFHVFPNLETGRMSVYREFSHASADAFRIRLVGRGGHAGYPHLAVDPVGATAELLLALRTLVSRETDPLTSSVVSVGRVRAGETGNVLPESSEIEGTIRCLGEGIRDRMLARIEAMVEGIASAHRLSGEVHWSGACPANRSHPGIAERVAEAAQAVLGKDRVLRLRPAMGAEDFAFFAERVPAAMFRLGCTAPGDSWEPLHSPRFRLDEACLPLAAEILGEAALSLLASGI